MATAEYAIATLAAVGFAGVLVFIMRSDEVRGFLLNLIRRKRSLCHETSLALRAERRPEAVPPAPECRGAVTAEFAVALPSVVTPARPAARGIGGRGGRNSVLKKRPGVVPVRWRREPTPARSAGSSASSPATRQDRGDARR